MRCPEDGKIFILIYPSNENIFVISDIKNNACSLRIYSNNTENQKDDIASSKDSCC